MSGHRGGQLILTACRHVWLYSPDRSYSPAVEPSQRTSSIMLEYLVSSSYLSVCLSRQLEFSGRPVAHEKILVMMLLNIAAYTFEMLLHICMCVSLYVSFWWAVERSNSKHKEHDIALKFKNKKRIRICTPSGFWSKIFSFFVI